MLFKKNVKVKIRIKMIMIMIMVMKIICIIIIWCPILANEDKHKKNQTAYMLFIFVYLKK